MPSNRQKQLDALKRAEEALIEADDLTTPPDARYLAVQRAHGWIALAKALKA